MKTAFTILLLASGNAFSQPCFDALLTDPELAPIKDKVALSNTKEQTFEMLTNSSIPSEQEKKAIAIWVSKRDSCILELPTVPDQIKALNASALSKVKLLIADLYLGKLTYGEFAQKRAANANEFSVASQAIMSGNARSVEATRPQIQVQMPTYTPPPMQPYMIPVKPTTYTNCQTLGNQMNCSTR